MVLLNKQTNNISNINFHIGVLICIIFDTAGHNAQRFFFFLNKKYTNKSNKSNKNNAAMELAGWESGRHNISVIFTHFAVHNLFILSDGRLENSFCPVQTKMHSAFLPVHMGKVAYACWEIMKAILSHISGQLRGFRLPGRGWRCFWRGQWSVTLFDLSCACEGGANRSLKPSKGQGFLPGLQFLQVSSVAAPCIDYCHCNGVPPNVDVPSSGSEVELLQCR